VNQIFNKVNKIFEVVAVFILLLFSFSVGANAQALPGENTPPEQNPTQVGLPKPNKSGFSSLSSSSQASSGQIINPPITTNPVTNQTVATPSTTVRSGGGSWLFFVFVLIAAYFGYNYWMNHQKKSTLKTTEKKLKL
jgi:hypothetical protein